MGELDTRLASIEAALAALSAHIEHLRDDLSRLPDRSDISEIIDTKIMRCAQTHKTEHRTPVSGVPRPGYYKIDWTPIIKGVGMVLAGVGAAIGAIYGASLLP